MQSFLSFQSFALLTPTQSTVVITTVAYSGLTIAQALSIYTIVVLTSLELSAPTSAQVSRSQISASVGRSLSVAIAATSLVRPPSSMSLLERKLD